MKKVLLMGLTALLAAACSQEEEKTSTLESSVQVPIEFDVVANSNTTRGSLEATEEFSLNDVAVFCLAKNVMNEGVAAGLKKAYIKYDNSNNAVNGVNVNDLVMWKFNESAKISSTVQPGKGILEWDNGRSNFYPKDQYFNYEFFAYYPKTDDVVASTYTITPRIRIDGSTDVIYAISEEASDDPNGWAFSWKYFRDYATPAKPYFKFKHLLSKLNFQVKLNRESDEDLRVDRIYIENMYNIVKPIYRRADKRTEFETQRAALTNSYWPYDTSSKALFELREKDNSTISGQTGRGGGYKYALSTTAVKVGDCIMIPPIIRLAATGGAYKAANHGHVLTVKVDVKNELDETYTFSFKLTPPESSNEENGWLEGKQYNVLLTVDPTKAETPALILFDAQVSELEGWEDASSDPTVTAVED